MIFCQSNAILINNYLKPYDKLQPQIWEYFWIIIIIFINKYKCNLFRFSFYYLWKWLNSVALQINLFLQRNFMASCLDIYHPDIRYLILHWWNRIFAWQFWLLIISKSFCCLCWLNYKPDLERHETDMTDIHDTHDIHERGHDSGGIRRSRVGRSMILRYWSL